MNLIEGHKAFSLSGTKEELTDLRAAMMLAKWQIQDTIQEKPGTAKIYFTNPNRLQDSILQMESDLE